MKLNRNSYLYNVICVVFSIAVMTSENISLADHHAVAEQNASAASNTIKDIIAWWPGDYNNQKQLAQLSADGKPIWREDDSGKGGHIEVESHYRVVDLPQFGDHVLYVEELKHGKPDLIFRQRIYTVFEDSTGAVKVKLWYFNDKKKYMGAWKDLSKLEGLSKDEMFPLQDACDLAVSKQGKKYHMPMLDKECIFGKKYFNYQVLLGPNSFWFRDKINFVENDKLDSTAGDFTYHELDKLN